MGCFNHMVFTIYQLVQDFATIHRIIRTSGKAFLELLSSSSSSTSERRSFPGEMRNVRWELEMWVIEW
jgi:hypothetical protein